MKTTKLLEYLLALIMVTAVALPLYTLQGPVSKAMPVTDVSNDIIQWDSGGLSVAASLAWNPEYLKLVVDNQQHTDTEIFVEGQDTYGQNIEAKVIVPANAPAESWYVFNDTHTIPPRPVAFAKITGIFQQNGTHGDMFSIYTESDLPDFVAMHDQTFEEYLGQYHQGSGLELGQFYPNHPTTPHVYGIYYYGRGQGQTPGIQNVPVEPSNPDPIKVVVNWNDKDGDLYPTIGDTSKDTYTAAHATSDLYIVGLDEQGNLLNVTVHFTQGVTTFAQVNAGLHTWSTICEVSGGSNQDSYYLLTEQQPERKLFSYTLRIDHVSIQPCSYDILAYPDAIDGLYPGVTNITVVLRDIDGNIIHSADDDTHVNLATTGGWIKPSTDIYIPHCHVAAQANLTADTNARTIKVTALVYVPEYDLISGHITEVIWPDEYLTAWTEMTFDGINSVMFDGAWPIHEMMWGFTDTYGTSQTLPVPPKQFLPPELGGPNVTDTGTATVKLDGPIYEVMIPLYVGCNLISSPVHPMMSMDINNTLYYDQTYPTLENHDGIPMELLFGHTSALDSIEAIFWLTDAGDWDFYVPGVTTGEFFKGDRGYWIKAEKPCTLEISGVFMENGPFTPPVTVLRAQDWNLCGVTSLTGISISEYLESTMGSVNIEAAGPVWVYYAKYGMWVRNPSWGLWPTEAFWVFNKVPADLYLAP